MKKTDEKLLLNKNFSSAEAYVTKLTAKKKIPYLDISVYKDHKPIWRWFGGDGRESVTGSEKILLYSSTKPLTAVCAMRLIEDGKLSLDDEVGKWLPAYNDIFLIDENGKKRAPKRKMLVRHLMTMTAGLSYDLSRYPITETIEKNGGDADTETLVSCFANAPLLFDPGERYAYSLCLDVLAAVIEKASGMAFSEYMRKIILSPLGMNDSYFSKDTSGLCRQYISVGNEIEPLDETNTDLILSRSYESGGAGLISTVDDYIKFADTLACGASSGGYSPISKASVREMTSPQVSKMNYNGTFTCVQGDDYSYGLGVRTRIRPGRGIPVGEFGWDGAACSYVLMDPVNKLSIFMGMNVISWPNFFSGEHLNIVEEIYKGLI